MIFVKGYGQMCNNILQYAHAYVWGKENHIDVVSMRFAYKYQYFEVCDSAHHRWPVYVWAKTLIKLRFIKCFVLDNPADITPEVISQLQERSMVAIDGWHFRFPELMLKYKTEIKQMFALKSSVVAKVKSYLLKKTKGADICLGVHIRRGDYKNWMDGKYFFDDEVYINHIAQFLNHHPGKQVVVFICTNDSRLNIETYRDKLGIQSVHLSKGNEAEDLFTLSQCDYIIGVKSTFSLVASFYNDSPLFWIADKDQPLEMEGFQSFEELFMSV